MITARLLPDYCHFRYPCLLSSLAALSYTILRYSSALIFTVQFTVQLQSIYSAIYSAIQNDLKHRMLIFRHCNLFYSAIYSATSCIAGIFLPGSPTKFISFLHDIQSLDVFSAIISAKYMIALIGWRFPYFALFKLFHLHLLVQLLVQL